MSAGAGTNTRWDLGTFGEVSRRKCPFCELIASICSKHGASWGPLVPPDDSVQVVARFGNARFDVQYYQTTGSFVCLAAEESESDAFNVRAEPEWINFKDVRGWISECEKKHGGRCASQRYNPAMLPRNSRRQLDFRLIDVEKMCLVYAPRACRYLALSYVWGKPDDGRLLLKSHNEDALMVPGALQELYDSVPTTILDTISVVRSLSERYLWVDSLCLVQDDLEELQDCVAIMDLFYEMAALTIVAATGSNAWAGLPGVWPRPRKYARKVNEIMPGLKMTTISHVDTLLRRSYYSTRAWT
jgi:Heterokaryon incompatibility protein (HET)